MHSANAMPSSIDPSLIFPNMTMTSSNMTTANVTFAPQVNREDITASDALLTLVQNFEASCSTKESVLRLNNICFP